MIKTFRFDSDSDFSANSYVVGEKEKPCVVIDLGSNDRRIIDYIKENHTSVSGILLTHGHFDHIKGINNFLNYYHATIFIDRNDIDLLTNTRLNGSFLGDRDVLVESNDIYEFDDEDELDFHDGLLFKVIETPFHTKGSVCFLYQKENALFSGDTLFKGSIGRTDLPGGSERTVSSSLAKLKSLDPNLIVYPGHGDTTTLKRELKYNMYLK